MLLLWESTVLLHPSGLALWPWPARRWWAGTCSTLFPFMYLAQAKGWGMEWPEAGCGMQLAAFHVLVDRLSVLLLVKLRLPVKPSHCFYRDLSYWVDWKTVEVSVTVLGLGLCSWAWFGYWWPERASGASTWPGRATCLCCGHGRAFSH